jgi:NADPH:quinone reductase-like Zn-dependent oxidoreductase
MKAVRIHQYGHANVLRVEEAPRPVAGADEILVRVVASSVNPVEWKIREGWLREMVPHALPLTLGWDVSGVVEELGAGVTHFKVGDAVYARPDIARNGTHAEYIVMRASEAAFKPVTLSHVDAAALPLAGITAWEALVNVGKVAPGMRVLVHAASGGVGTLAVQIAKARGAHVLATCSHANHALVASLGADQLIDYRNTRFEAVARDVDIVFDTLGGSVQEASWSTLKPGGLLVSIISPPDQARAAAAGLRSAFIFIGPDAPVLAQLADLVDDGKLRPVIGAEFAVDDIAAAHALSESGHARGKIVVYVGHP